MLNRGNSMFWSDLREEEFNPAMEKAEGVCVVPFGCVEKHGQHLPLGTDTILAERTLKLVDEKEPIVIFPPLWFGNYPNSYQGTSPKDCTRNLGAAFTEIIVKQAIRDIKAIKKDEEALKVNEWINSCH